MCVLHHVIQIHSGTSQALVVELTNTLNYNTAPARACATNYKACLLQKFQPFQKFHM